MSKDDRSGWPSSHTQDSMWDVIVPGKRLFESKGRLSSEVAGSGPALARSMMEDTLHALRASQSVHEIIVVTNDPVLIAVTIEYGGLVARDPDMTLNAALASGLVRTCREASRVAYFVADLPCLTAETVDAVLAQSARSPSAVVPDKSMRETTILTTSRTAGVEPQFGHGSFARHLAAGAVPVGLELERARHDVDWWADLAAARKLGLGPSTSDAERRIRLGR